MQPAFHNLPSGKRRVIEGATMSKVVRAASVALAAIFAIVPASKGTTHRGIDGSGADGSLDRRSLSARMTQMYSQLPISFEPNRGQTDPRVKFVARGAGYGLFLTPTEGRLVLRSADTHSLGADAHLPGTRADSAQHSAALSMQFVGANPAPA